MVLYHCAECSRYVFVSVLSAVGMFSYPNLYANSPRQELDHVYLSIKIDNRGLDKIFKPRQSIILLIAER